MSIDVVALLPMKSSAFPSFDNLRRHTVYEVNIPLMWNIFTFRFNMFFKHDADNDPMRRVQVKTDVIYD